VARQTVTGTSSLRSNMLITIVLSSPHRPTGNNPHAMRPDPERTLVASDRMARIDLTVGRPVPWMSQLGGGERALSYHFPRLSQRPGTDTQTGENLNHSYPF
jgi:hypothetical protein